MCASSTVITDLATSWIYVRSIEFLLWSKYSPHRLWEYLIYLIWLLRHLISEKYYFLFLANVINIYCTNFKKFFFYISGWILTRLLYSMLWFYSSQKHPFWGVSKGFICATLRWLLHSTEWNKIVPVPTRITHWNLKPKFSLNL